MAEYKEIKRLSRKELTDEQWYLHRGIFNIHQCIINNNNLEKIKRCLQKEMFYALED